MRVAFLQLLFTLITCASNHTLLDRYREGGVKSLLKEAEKSLQSKEYWLSRLNRYDTDFGYYEDIEYLLLTNKSFPTLDVYKFYKDRELFELIEILNAYVGEKSGHKSLEGDKKTPTGVYTLTERLSKLDQFYGPLAFVTSYPNLYDRLKNRTGSGIWIHGLPIKGDRDSFTRGCIAIENDKIVSLDKEINLKKTLLIISDKKLQKTSKSDLALILSSLYKWLDAWRDSDIDRYLSFYDSKRFYRYDRKRFKWFKNYKSRIFSRKRETTIRFSNINISPYPNSQNRKLFYITFQEFYRAGDYRFNGQKSLYVELQKGYMKILIEK